MARSQESFNKKETRNRKEKKRKEKEKKRLARKEKEKKSSFDDMIAYVDENGNISSSPPDPDKKKEVKLEDIEIGIPKKDESFQENTIREGIVTFYNESKGFGFIKDRESNDSIFMHVNNMLEEVREGNVVNYEIEKGQKGLVAVKIRLFNHQT